MREDGIVASTAAALRAPHRIDYVGMKGMPTLDCHQQRRAQYDHLKIRSTNKARVAIARKLLTISFQILRDQGAYKPLSRTSEVCSTRSPIQRVKTLRMFHENDTAFHFSKSIDARRKTV